MNLEEEIQREEKVLAMMARCIDGMDSFSNKINQSSQSYEPKNTMLLNYEEALENMKKVLDETKDPFEKPNTTQTLSIEGKYAHPDKVVPFRERHPRLRLIASSVAAALTPAFYSAYNTYQR